MRALLAAAFVFLAQFAVSPVSAAAPVNAIGGNVTISTCERVYYTVLWYRKGTLGLIRQKMGNPDLNWIEFKTTEALRTLVSKSQDVAIFIAALEMIGENMQAAMLANNASMSDLPLLNNTCHAPTQARIN